MAGVARRYGLYSVGFGSSIVGGITKQTIATETEVRGETTGGDVYSRFLSVTSQKPGGSFSTMAIAAALNQCALLGVDISGLTGGFSLYAQKHAEGGTRAGSLAHRQFVFNEGLVVPRTLSVDHRGDASIDYDVVATYDGTNDPVVINDGVTLPAAATDNERFTVGPLTIGGETIDHVRSISLDFGVEVATEGADSEVWDRFASIVTVKPKLTVRGIDIEWLKSSVIPLSGKAATHANTTVYLRKRDDGGTFVADATEEHISLTMAGLATIDTAMDASGSDAAEASLELMLQYDGTNNPVVIDTTAAIS